MGLKSRTKGKAGEREAANECEWRPIPCTAGAYLASSNGDIRRARKLSVGRQVRTASVQIGKSNGYGLVNIQFGDKWKVVTVHSLIADAFIGPRPDGLQVNHKDGNKLNNSASNLEYVTRSGNMKHAISSGLWSPPIIRGERNHKTNLTSEDIHRIISLENTQTKTAIAKQFSVSRTCVADIYSGKTWFHVTGRSNRRDK